MKHLKFRIFEFNYLSPHIHVYTSVFQSTNVAIVPNLFRGSTSLPRLRLSLLTATRAYSVLSKLSMTEIKLSYTNNNLCGSARQHLCSKEEEI